MDLDPKTKTYHPENEATFLFVTRDGTTGILQVTNLVTELFRPDDFGKPAEPQTSPRLLPRREVPVQVSFGRRGRT